MITRTIKQTTFDRKIRSIKRTIERQKDPTAAFRFRQKLVNVFYRILNKAKTIIKRLIRR